MADTLKVLAQAAPAATTETVLYTVPAGKSTTTSTLVICNRNAVSATFRVSVAVAGVATANNQYIYYDQILDGNSSFAVTIGMTLAASDVIRVYASTANLSFNLFGVEVA